MCPFSDRFVSALYEVQTYPSHKKNQNMMLYLLYGFDAWESCDFPLVSCSFRSRFGTYKLRVRPETVRTITWLTISRFVLILGFSFICSQHVIPSWRRLIYWRWLWNICNQFNVNNYRWQFKQTRLWFTSSKLVSLNVRKRLIVTYHSWTMWNLVFANVFPPIWPAAPRISSIWERWIVSIQATEPTRILVFLVVTRVRYLMDRFHLFLKTSTIMEDGYKLVVFNWFLKDFHLGSWLW